MKKETEKLLAIFFAIASKYSNVGNDTTMLVNIAMFQNIRSKKTEAINIACNLFNFEERIEELGLNNKLFVSLEGEAKGKEEEYILLALTDFPTAINNFKDEFIVKIDEKDIDEYIDKIEFAHKYLNKLYGESAIDLKTIKKELKKIQ